MSDQPTGPATPPTDLPPHAIAFVIDDVVQDQIWTQDRMAAILLSKPLIVKSTGIEGIVVGQTLYNSETGEFVQQDGTVLAQPSSQEIVPPLEKE
jgi:hypothetical protein